MEYTSVSFIVCATDEESSLKKTVNDVLTLCENDPPDRVILVLSRNATEGCRRTAAECEAMCPDTVKYIIQDRPGLLGAALDAAELITSSHTIGLSADYSISLDNLPIMIENAKHEPDVIFKNSRFLKKNSFDGYPPLKMLANIGGQIFLRLLFRTKLTDLTSPLQIMPTCLYRNINWHESGFAFLEEMVLIPLRLGFRIVELPAKSLPRTEGNSKNSFSQTAKYFTAALRIRFLPKSDLLNT